MADLAGAAQLVKPGGRVDVARHVVVPPMQLHQIEAVHAEARQRAVDAAHHVGPRVRCQPIEVGYVLGVHLHGHVGAGRATPLQPLADQRFHAGVDVRAVERRDARVHEPIHVGQRRSRVDRAVAAGQLPPALQQARDGVAGRELSAGQLHDHPWRQRHGRHVAVAKRARADAGDAEPCAAVGVGTRDVGVGGHPVVRVGHALLRRKDGQERRQRINGKGLSRRQREVLPAQLEPVAGAMAAHHGPIRRHHFDAQIVELERVVTIVHAVSRGTITGPSTSSHHFWSATRIAPSPGIVSVLASSVASTVALAYRT